MADILPKRLAGSLEGTPLAADWVESQRSFSGKTPSFLSPAALSEAGTWAGLPPEAIAFCREAAAHIASDPDLTPLAWHAHNVLFIARTANRSETNQWPLLVDVLGDYCGAFYLLIILSGIPGIRTFHQERGVPDDVARDTYSDTAIWVRQYNRIGVPRDNTFFHPGKDDSWGLAPRILPWLLSHLYGDLYKVGRLQYKVGPFRQRLRAYRNRTSCQVCLLAESGVSFRTSDGRIDGSGGVCDPAAWTAELVEGAEAIEGFPIHPSGGGIPRKRILRHEEWSSVLRQGDTTLEIHIPEDGPMGYEACGESLRRASEFFPRHFPDRPFKAIVCGSWLCDPTYQRILTGSSNIVRFQRECYLFPLDSSGGRSGIPRIFYQYANDLARAPRDTSMRRAVLDHLEGGGVLISGGALVFPEDLDWGKQVYLSMFEESEAEE